MKTWNDIKNVHDLLKAWKDLNTPKSLPRPTPEQQAACVEG